MCTFRPKVRYPGSGSTFSSPHHLALNHTTDLAVSGNDALHGLTTGRPQVLRVDLKDWDNTTRYAEYHFFLVEDEGGQYRLHVGQYSGDAGDGLSPHDNMFFTTTDRDNDKSR